MVTLWKYIKAWKLGEPKILDKIKYREESKNSQQNSWEFLFYE